MSHGEETDKPLALLMRAAQDGDGAAYLRLLGAVTPLLRQTIARRNRSLRPQDVEDLVQDTLLSLHMVRATYDPGRPFLPWLMAIARNRMADGTRRYARSAANEVPTDRLPETFSPESTNMLADAYADPQALRRALEDLPPGQRDAIVMLKLQEMSLKEAATASGSSIGALKVAVHRGMSSLRKALGAGTGP